MDGRFSRLGLGKKGEPMALSFALDELLTTGWTGLDSAGCAFDSDGRAYPTLARVRREFNAAGFELHITRSDQFDCFRARWREAGEAADAGAVVGQSESEACVYALAQLRRTLKDQAAHSELSSGVRAHLASI